MNSSGFGYSFDKNYKAFVLKFMAFFVLCMLPSDATDCHHVPVFQMVTDILYNFLLFFPANTFILHATSIFNQAEEL